MTFLPQFLHESAALGAASALLYTGTVAATALTAILAPTPQRRRAARDVLVLLLHRPPNKP
jgi:hypothetical protein